MKNLRKLWSMWAAVMDFFARPLTVDQDARQRKEKAAQVVEDAERSMMVQSYHRHLALAEIDALKAWEQGYVRTGKDAKAVT